MSFQFHKIRRLPPYLFAEVNAMKAAARKSGRDIIDFGMGNPDSAPPSHVMDELSNLSTDPSLYGYSVVGGIKNLKKAITDYYKRRFDVEVDYELESIVTIGAKEGIASLATAISDNENYICVPSPSYPIHTFAFTISKTNIVHIPAITAQDFLEKFKNHVENSLQKPQAVVVSYPCNPTTETADLQFYQEMVDFCKKNKIYIISDIAYCEIYFDEKNKPHSILEIKGAKDIAIEFSSVSKSFSMAGARIGFAVGNKDLINALYKIKSYLDYGSFTPLQISAISALSSKSDNYLSNLRNLYKDRADFFVKTFAEELAWHIDKPKASMFCWAKLPREFADFSSFDFCKKMILDAGVAMSPGSSFGQNGEGYVRFSMIRNNQEVYEATQRLKTIFPFKM